MTREPITNKTDEVNARLDAGDRAVLLDATPLGIERSEAQGQRELVEAGTRIPTDRRPREDAKWEELGFKFGAVVPGDPLFQAVELPKGWAYEGTEHSMGSVIRDGDGFRMVTVFYKAAFYDRNASATLAGVPTTDAQDGTTDRLYREHSERDGDFERGAPMWRTPDRRALADRSVELTYRRETVNAYPIPADVHETRVVVVAPDGTITSDRTT